MTRLAQGGRYEIESVIGGRSGAADEGPARLATATQTGHTVSRVMDDARGSSGREGLLVARIDAHGQLTPAGVVQLGLAGERRLALQQLAGVARPDRRLAIAGVLVDVAHHGARGGPLRDPVLRHVISAAAAERVSAPGGHARARARRSA